MQRFLLVLVIALSSLLGGCSRDGDVVAFMGKLDGFTAELVKRVETSSDKKSGVESAQRYFDEHKVEIESAYGDIKNVRGFQVEEATMKKLETNLIQNTTKVAGLKLELIRETTRDRELDEKLDRLEKSYTGLLGG